MIIVVVTDSEAVKSDVVNAAYEAHDGLPPMVRIVAGDGVAADARLGVIAGALIQQAIDDSANAAVNGFGQDLARAIGR